jgi:hypothetical protein
MKAKWLYAAFILTIFGCGGALNGKGAITGLVLDTDGNPVRGARVFVTSPALRETVSTNSGSYRLDTIEAVDATVQAEITKDGVLYQGATLARVFDQAESQNRNITLIRASDSATLQGRVFGQGLAIEGARLSARPTSGGIYSSTQALTDSNGNYVLTGLAPGASYQITASFPGFTAAEVLRTFSAGQTQSVNFNMTTAGDPLLPKPANVSATSWTTPSEVTRDAEASRAIDKVKAFIDPRYKKNAGSSRQTAGGNTVEVQLFWDKIDSLQLLGYAISRKRGTDAWQDLDFLRDPLAETYVDGSIALREDVQYSYSLSASNVNYPDTNNSEGDYSDAVSVVPLGDMVDNGVLISGGNVTFRWQALNGAANYTVYVFDEFPGIRVSSYDNNFGSPATGTSFTYNLRPLLSGRRYYYLVMAATSDDTARSLSRIGSFVAP